MNKDGIKEAAYFLLRLVAGMIFIQAGGLKLFGWFGGMPPNGATAAPMTEPWIGGILEVFGGSLIILGLFMRPVAFLLCGEMAVAYWQFHFPMGRWPIINHGEPAVLLCFVYLYMAARGAGAWSLDAWIRSRRRATVPR